jgi:hypothetical protein
MADDLTPDPNASLSLRPGNAIQGAIDTQSQINLGTNFNEADASLPNDLRASSDNATVSPNAPVTEDTSLQEIQIDPANRGDLIKNNCLDDYMNVTYGVSLAMVSLSAVKGIQTEMESDPNGLSVSDYIVFACTGDTLTNTNTTEDYYNIKRLVFTSFAGHLPQNPMTAVIWDGKMSLFEPHGFALREDMERMRADLGYDPVAPWNYIYRLEIWFSGYHGQTGAWVPRISIPVDGSRELKSIVYYLTITTIDAQVTPQGTEYDMSFQMYSHKALRADSLIFRMEATQAGNNANSGDSKAPKAAQNTVVKFGTEDGGPATFGDFIKNLVVALKQQVSFDTEGWLDIIYKIHGPQWLFDEKFDSSGKISISHGSVSYDSNSGTYTYASQDVDIFTFIYKVMDHLPLVQKLLLQPQDKEFIKPSVTWNVRTNIKYTGNFEPTINGYRGYTFEYYVEPYLSFRSRTTETKDRNRRAEYNNQRQRADAIVNYGMLLRVYDFIFTPDNSEIIDFHFRFKNFYQEPYPNTGSDTTRTQSTDADDANYQKERDDLRKEQSQQDQASSSGPNIQFSPSSSQSLSSVLGIASSPQSSTTQLPYAVVHGDLMRGPDLPASQNARNSEGQVEMKLYQRAKDQYFRYDMLSADMTVRFDPLWLMNPYMVGGDFTPKLTSDKTTEGVFLYVHTDRVVFIKAFKPNQSDYMNPNRRFGSSDKTPFLGGFYQVITAVNEFDGGKFIQKLNLFKYPHMNGFNTLTGDSIISQGDSTNTTPPGAASSPTIDAVDPSTLQALGS